jgi:hypothetical protein
MWIGQGSPLCPIDAPQAPRTRCVALPRVALPCAASLTPRQPVRHGRLLQGRRLQGLSSPSCASRQSSQSHSLHQRPIPRSGLPVPSLPLLPLVTTPSGRLRALLHPRQQLHEPQRSLSYSHARRRCALPARRTTLCHALKEIRDCCLPSHLARADWLPTLPFSAARPYLVHHAPQSLTSPSPWTLIRPAKACLQVLPLQSPSSACPPPASLRLRAIRPPRQYGLYVRPGSRGWQQLTEQRLGLWSNRPHRTLTCSCHSGPW